jgi:hypothetical protein
MKVKIEMTVEVDRKAILSVIPEWDEETPSEFVKSFIMSSVNALDEQIQNETGEYHQTEVLKANHPSWGGAK